MLAVIKRKAVIWDLLELPVTSCHALLTPRYHKIDKGNNRRPTGLHFYRLTEQLEMLNECGW
jgi:hypothetical protein